MSAGRMLKALAVLVLLVLVFTAGWVTARLRAGEAIDPVQLPVVEQQFIDRMRGAALVGHFTMRGRGGSDIPDRYDIYGVDKVGEDLWRFNAKIGETGLTLPVVVRMRFVDDTPVILMTDASIPGMGGGFSARVLFHGDYYAGTWGHGADAGGLMYGRIERAAAQR